MYRRITAMVVAGIIAIIAGATGMASAVKREVSPGCWTHTCAKRVWLKHHKRRVVGHVATASWYGPGLYGNHLGCGGTLTAATYGVAHKTIACHKILRICYNRSCTQAPVVDRGPYVAGRELDLTYPVRKAIGMPPLGQVTYTVVG